VPLPFIELTSFGYLHQPTGTDGQPVLPTADRTEDVRERLRDPAATQAVVLYAGSRVLGLRLKPARIAAALAPTLLADAASYLASAWQLSRIHPTEPPAAARAKGDLMAGFRYLIRSRILRSFYGAVTTLNLFNLGAVPVRVLRWGDSRGFGICMAGRVSTFGGESFAVGWTPDEGGWCRAVVDRRVGDQGECGPVAGRGVA
jgi:hypothetical protein